MNGNSAICVPVGNGLFNYRVAGVAVHEGKILLHKSESDKFWSLPGGRVDMFEFSAEALSREMMEELGCEIKIEKLIAIAENFFEYKLKRYHEIGFYYLMKVVGLTDYSDKILAEENEDLLFRWLDIQSFDEETIYPKIPIRELIANQDVVRHFRFGLQVLEPKSQPA